MAKTYRVAIQGLREGFTRERAIEQLMPLFKRPAQETGRLLDSKGMVVKMGVDLATARRYQEVLEKRGCVCSIDAEGVSVGEATQVLRRYSSEEHEEFFSRPAKPNAVKRREETLKSREESDSAQAVAAPEPPRAADFDTAPVADAPMEASAAHDIARYRRPVLVSIIASLAGNAVLLLHPGLWAVVLAVVIALASLWGVYRLCRAIGFPAGAGAMVTLIPLFNSFGMLYLERKAAGLLKGRG